MVVLWACRNEILHVFDVVFKGMFTILFGWQEMYRVRQ
jgi:hypothetical protein